MTACNYVGAWDTLLLLQVLIPPECEKETKYFYSKAEKIIFKPVAGHDRIAAIRLKDRQVNTDGPQAIRNLIGEIRISLFKNGWINKEFGIRPTNPNEGHIGSKRQ